MINLRRWLLTLLSMLFSGHSIAFDGSLTAEQVRAAMQSERSKIANGMFTANGSYSIFVGKELEKKDSFQWRYEFSYPDEKFLFDRSENCTADRETRAGDSDRLRVFFCEDATARYTYHDLVIPTAALHIHPSDHSDKDLSHHFQRIDVRGFGIGNASNICALSVIGDKFFFEPSVVTIDIQSDIQVIEENSNILRLSFEKILPETDRRIGKKLWVDRSKGFAPMRLVSFLDDQQEMECRSEWALVNDTWVPIELTGNIQSPTIPNGKEVKIENIETRKEDFRMNLKWETVNRVSENSNYVLQAFDLPEGTRVFKDGEVIHIYGH